MRLSRFVYLHVLYRGKQLLNKSNQKLLEALAHEINSCGATETSKALALYQNYIVQALDAVAVIWCALYRGPYGKEVWHTIVMNDWKVFDMVFPEGVQVDMEETRAKFYSKARKEGGLGPGILVAMNAVGSTRAHLIEEAIAFEEWKKHWEYTLLLKQGVSDRMSGAYYLSNTSESHVWVDRGIGKPRFNLDEKDELVRIMNRFPKLHRWLMLERGLLEPASRPLSPREKDVLQLLLSPLSEVEIAEKLKLAKGTVHNYIIGIYKTFGVSGRYQLLQLWLD